MYRESHQELFELEERRDALKKQIDKIETHISNYNYFSDML